MRRVNCDGEEDGPIFCYRACAKRSTGTAVSARILATAATKISTFHPGFANLTSTATRAGALPGALRASHA